MTLRNKVFLGIIFFSFFQLSIHAQNRDRNIEEVKAESLLRAERGAYPLGGLNIQDVRDALDKVPTRNPDDWATGWSAIADKYVDQAKQATDPEKASALYKKAWRLYYFAQWPAPTSPKKQIAYNNAIAAYLNYAKNFDPPLTVVKIPFEGKEIIGYLRMPKKINGPVPLIFAFSGLDSRKETVADSYGEILKYGVAIFVLDSPGTGQAPIKASPTANRMFSAALDYITQMPNIDKNRIIASGVSFGGYWAAKLAITEKDRLLGSVAQSPPIDKTAGFTLKNTYLITYPPQFLSMKAYVQKPTYLNLHPQCRLELKVC